MIELKTLENYLKDLLQINLYDDYGPNGLQIEGKSKILKIVFSVSATRESIQLAILKNADALIVHHGIFWKFHGIKTITGSFKERIAPLVKNEINLLAYHLPLDGNQELGNAASIAKKLNLTNLLPFGIKKGMPIGIKGHFKNPVTAIELKNKLEQLFAKNILSSNPEIHHSDKKINSIGVITGGANNEWILAKEEGLDAYLTGEMSEHNFHDANEAGIYMFAGGHHATEKLGIISLMNHLQNQFPTLQCEFIDSINPA